MESLTSHELTIFLLVIGTMLILAQLLAKLGKRIRMPTLIAEIIAGILLGPTILGKFFPDLHQFLFPDTGGLPFAYGIIFNLSVVMLLFMGGMEIEFDIVAKEKRSIFMTTVLSILFPLSVGIFSGWYFFDFFHGTEFSATPFVFPLIFGAFLTISALPVILRILMHEKILNTKVGITIVGTAVITDVIGWLGFSSILVYANPAMHNIEILYTIFYVSLLVIAVFIISGYKSLIDKLFPKADTTIKKESTSYNIASLFGICLLCGALTNYIGIHPTLGAFIAGILCKRFFINSPELLEHLNVFIMNFFAPIFFISIGLQIDFAKNFNFPMIAAVFLLAIITKTVGGFLGAWLGGIKSKPALLVATCLNGRGVLEIIMGVLALKLGLIFPQLFVAIVIMAVVTVLAPLYMVPLMIEKFNLPRSKES